MNLTLERIGAVQYASIDLVGLTVIAGENDTGKSTLGKVSFALVQAFSTFPIAVKKNNGARLRRELDMLYFEIRRGFDIARHPDIRHFFSSLRVHSTDVQSIPFSDIEKLIQVLEVSDTQEFDEKLDKPSARGTSRLPQIRRRIERLRQEFERTVTDEQAIGRLVHQALSSEFAGEIQNVSTAGVARISLTDGATAVLEMKITNSDVVEFSGGEPLGLRDATLVDGPSILQYYPAISGYDGLGFGGASYRAAIPYHTVDLANKLKGAHDGFKFSKEEYAPFCDVFAGEVVYDDENENFYLKRGSLKIPSVNIASGIKALSIVDMLRKGDYINDDTLLILDEPETNLHPTWQIAYARAICHLVEVGARILVTTHSPYMLEALRGYCSDGIDSKFYFAERDADGVVRYIDTLGDISEIIETLSKPLSDFLEEISGDDF
ncbi:AAA family ATPase [uncultured Zoogloea sp.]|uniref:AAA family ATPase n=1 Tax=uncultured Zoogloea sp. TaxID=160237 RepID=UPI00261DD951|nr:AAA family ATPase [uncultured Zoogloea sp.]